MGSQMHRRDVLAFGLASVSTAALRSLPASAQTTYPERPIRLVVPRAAGGVVDVVARLWAERAKPQLGGIVIENQGGGGGTIAATAVARAAGDGYTLLAGTTSELVINPVIMSQPSYDPIKDLVPISITAISVSSLIVHEFGAGTHAAGADRLRQGQSGHALLRLGRHRHARASVRRAVQDTRWPARYRARAVQRRRSRAGGFLQRPYPDDDGEHLAARARHASRREDFAFWWPGPTVVSPARPTFRSAPMSAFPISSRSSSWASLRPPAHKSRSSSRLPD